MAEEYWFSVAGLGCCCGPAGLRLELAKLYAQLKELGFYSLLPLASVLSCLCHSTSIAFTVLVNVVQIMTGPSRLSLTKLESALKTW